MDVEYEVIRPKFEQLRDYVLHDLKVLLQSHDGVNYTTALLIACACEALAWFQYGHKNKGHQFLADMMLPQVWKPVAKSLYDGLRDGLAHAFETMTMVVGSQRFEIGISWGNHTHLTFSPDCSVLYLNVYTLVEDLKQALVLYEQQLKGDGEARARFHETMRAMKNSFVKDVSSDPKQRAVWETLLASSPPSR